MTQVAQSNGFVVDAEERATINGNASGDGVAQPDPEAGFVNGHAKPTAEVDATPRHVDRWPNARPPAADPGAERAELIQRANDLYPLLKANAAQADKDRRLPQENIDAVVAAGLYKVWMPRRYGGYQADMTTGMEILAALARGCSATGWVGVLYTGCSFSMSLMTDEAQDDVWGANPDALVCGVLNPAGESRKVAGGYYNGKKVSGGYTISGSFGFASGQHHADWALLSIPINDDDGNMVNAGFFLVPRSELKVKDTWFTVGMRGTASNTLVAEDLYVPEYRVLPLLDETGQMYPTAMSPEADAMTLLGVSYGGLASVGTIGVPIGIARGALEAALEQLPKRSIAYTTYVQQRESVSTQTGIAAAATKIDAAYLLAKRAGGDLDRTANDGEELDMLTRARVRQDCGYATTLLREAVDEIQQICGASAAADMNPISRAFRDISTCTLHPFLGPKIVEEIYGRVLLGLDPEIAIV